MDVRELTINIKNNNNLLKIDCMLSILLYYVYNIKKLNKRLEDLVYKVNKCTVTFRVILLSTYSEKYFCLPFVKEYCTA